MCDLVCRAAKSYSKEVDYSNNTSTNSSASVCLPPKPEELVCKMPEPDKKDKTDVKSVDKSDHSPKKLTFPAKPVPVDDSDDTVQNTTGKASMITSTLHKVPTVIANIDELQSDATGVMSMASKFAGTTAKVISESKAFQIGQKVIGNPIVAKGAGVLGIVSGGFEVNKGIKEIKKGKEADGVYHIADGGGNIVAGAGLVFGSATLASGGAAFGVGLGVGHFGDNSTKELGWLKDKNGKAQSASDRLGDKMWDVHESVEKATGSNVLGHVVAAGAGIAMLPAAAVTAVGGAVVNGGKKIGSGIASAWNYVFN
jgi:hypothetical protein